ncbi:hypothetical protein LINPERHAP1_LOCUS13194 [Linum perenne]
MRGCLQTLTPTHLLRKTNLFSYYLCSPTKCATSIILPDFMKSPLVPCWITSHNEFPLQKRSVP